MLKKINVLLLVVVLLFSNYSVLAVPTTSKTQQSIETRKFIEENVKFEYSEKMFTLYTFLNYTGFKQNNGLPFHPVRNQILNDIKNKNPKLTEPNFYAIKDYDRSYYDYLLMIMDDDFNYRYSGKIPYEIYRNYGVLKEGMQLGLDKALKEFHKEANIHEIYLKYKPYHDTEINRIKNEVYNSLEFIFNEFNLDKENINQKVIIEMSKVFLIESGRAEINTEFLDYSRNNSIVMGYGLNKDNLADGSSFTHEILHIYVKPIIKKHEDKILKFASLNDLYSKQKGSYGDILTYVEEIFIRALESSYKGRFETDSYDADFTMSQKIYNYYKQNYSKNNSNLEKFILDSIEYFSPKNNEYQKGYDEGYKAGYEAALKKLKDTSN